MDTPTIGTLIHGGFFAGAINLNGEGYGVLVAPKEAGEPERVPWGKGEQEIPDAASLFDGLANTQAMAEAGSELAKWALGLDINGDQDWYIPSRDELELIYRHLKPTTEENWATARDGENPCSLPIGFPYTKALPTQTTVEAFQAGNAEALEDTWYWSSTQYSADSAWGQWFHGGVQLGNRKDAQARARAVRRFKLPI